MYRNITSLCVIAVTGLDLNQIGIQAEEIFGGRYVEVASLYLYCPMLTYSPFPLISRVVFSNIIVHLYLVQ